MNNIKNELAVFIIFLVPLFSFLWHFENKLFPVSDSVEYLDSAYQIYLYFHKGEYLNFLVSIFNERGWRPIIFQLFIFPFMLLSFGDILISVLMTHVFFNTLAVVFLYKIFCTFIINKYSSAICASILGLSFNIMFGGQPIPLFAEISFIAFLLATIFYLIQSDLFKKKRSSRLFTLFFTLTILVRPIEGLIILIPPIVVLIWKNYLNYVTIREILSGLSYPIFFIWLLFISRIFPDISSSVMKVDPPYSLSIFLYLTLVISLIYFTILFIIIFLKYNKNIFYKTPQKNFFKRSFFISSLVLWIWYTPRFGSLYGWIYDTSIGNTFAYLKLDIPSYGDLITNIIKSNGEILTYLVFFMFLFSVLSKIISNKSLNLSHEKYTSEFKNFTLMLVTSIPIPILLFFNTHQITYRKISPVIIILLIYFLTIILKNNKTFKINNILLSVFLFTQIIFLSENIFINKNNMTWNIESNNEIMYKIIGHQYPAPVKYSAERYSSLVSFLKEEKNNETYKKLTLVLGDEEFPIERYLFKFLCKKSDIQTKFFYPKNFSKENFSDLENEEVFLIIIPGKSDDFFSERVANKISMQLDEKKNRLSVADFNRYSFIYLFSTEALSKYNFSLKKCYNFIDSYNACLIRKLN